MNKAMKNIQGPYFFIQLESLFSILYIMMAVMAKPNAKIQVDEICVKTYEKYTDQLLA